MLKEINDKKAFLHNNNDHSNQNEMAPDRWWLEKNDEWCVWISFPLDANTNEFYFWREVRFLPRSLLLFFTLMGLKVLFHPFSLILSCVYVKMEKVSFSHPRLGGWWACDCFVTVQRRDCRWFIKFGRLTKSASKFTLSSLEFLLGDIIDWMFLGYSGWVGGWKCGMWT